MTAVYCIQRQPFSSVCKTCRFRDQGMDDPDKGKRPNGQPIWMLGNIGIMMNSFHLNRQPSHNVFCFLNATKVVADGTS
jgi:hypothetical protein